jgi:hypothetical protein
VNDAVKVAMIKWRIPDAVAKKSGDATSQIAARAYELYERQGRRDGESVQNWSQAEREIRKTKAETEPKSETKPAAKAESEPEAKANPKPEANVEPKQETKTKPGTEVKENPKPEAKAVPLTQANPEPKTQAKTAIEPQPESKDEPQSEANAKTEPKPATKLKLPSGVSPQLVERVHKFYEELGREDVRAVQKPEKSERKIPEAETKNKQTRTTR